jgi:hypothetical protein
MQAADIQQFLGGIPLTTIVAAVLLVVFRPDLWQELLESNADYFQISQTHLVFLSAATIALIMVLFGFFYRLYLSYVDHQKMLLESQELAKKERDALVAIFNSLGGKRWKDKTRWCSDEPIGRWKGVHLDPRTKRVNKIILAENELEGEIPEDLGNLTELIEVDMRLNRIKGKLPNSIVNLKKLEGLYLYDNFIGGEIPSEIADFPNLSGVYLFNNSFTNSKECAKAFREKLPESCYVFI